MKNLKTLCVFGLAVAMLLMGAWGVEAARKPLPTSVININTADVQTLTQLPGIGLKRAEQIVAYRSEHGMFRSPEELLKIKGIGEKSFENLRPYVTVGEVASAAPAPAPAAPAVP
jgi:competence protein ComEA